MGNSLWDYAVAFYFKVEITGIGTVDFCEVSGLDEKLEVKHLPEGGSSGYKIPTKSDTSKIILKRALPDINKVDDPIDEWLCDNLDNNGRVFPKDIYVKLLDEEGLIIYMWKASRAYPISRSVNALNARNNELAMETIELVYHELKRAL